MVILLVEDNAAHAELIRRTFENYRINTRLIVVNNGQAALDYLERRGEYADPDLSPRPELILLDLRLPKVDGIEVLRQIKTSQGLMDIPVVMMTSSSAPADVQRAYANNVNSYVVKPADYDQFTRMLRDLGFYWLNWNHTQKGR